MRIVDVCGFYSPKGGGVRSYVDQKFTQAHQHGHDLTVIAPGPDDRVEPRTGGRVVWVESPSMPFDPAYHRFTRPEPIWRAMDAATPDVVEGSSPWRGGWIAGHWQGSAARAFVFHQDFVAGYPHVLLGGVMTPHAIDRLFAPYWARLRRLSTQFDVTVTAGEWLASRLSRFGVHRPVAIPLGVEPDRFSPAHRDEALRQALLAECGLPPDGLLMLTVGRFHPEKRHRTIIEGFARARARLDQPMGLVLAGDGLTRAAVEKYAAQAGNVLLLGAVTDRGRLARLYASADVLLHGSAAETYGLVVAEAMASGLPVAAPAAGGAADLARLGASRLYAAGDGDALASALLELLADPPVRRAAPIPTAGEHFTALFDLYAGLIRQRAERPIAA